MAALIHLFSLQAVPFYNYPNFINLFGLALFIAFSFVYLGVCNLFGAPTTTTLPKRTFATMGLLDCIATTLQVFCSIYLPGPLLVLLPQTAIPLSMIISNRFLKVVYSKWQYIGAAIVILGILVVLEPTVSQRHVPDYICQTMDMDDYCTICNVETTEATCLSHVVPTVNNTTILYYPLFQHNLMPQHKTTHVFHPIHSGSGSGHATSQYW